MVTFQCLPGDAGYFDSDASGKKRNDFHIRGTSLGGWLVLEPWITPSLFYQFLGLTEKYGADASKHIAIDSKTFCSALGEEEANKQLRQHWRNWVDEEQIAKLAHDGVETLRIPLGDWMYVPYEPYIGCWDGALEELDRVLQLCQKYNLTVLLDIHAMRMSQNGLDNSGDTGSFEWLGEGSEYLNRESSPIVSRYRHWDIRGGNWVGDFNLTSQTYSSVNSTNIEDSLKAVLAIVERYKDHKSVIGLTPVNEPWWNIPLDVLKEYYWKSYSIVQEKAPHWITLMHDSFRLSPESWGSPWMENCDNWAMDTHLYQAWADTAPSEYFVETSCASLHEQNLALMESIDIPIVVGEWSLATDNCAMWLNGLNDNVPGFPKHDCNFVPCPASYMGPDTKFSVPGNQVNTFDPTGMGGPSYVVDGSCPQDAPFPDENGEVKKIAYAKLYTYDQQTHGNFYWNFRTEFDTRWDYQVAVQQGWIPRDWSQDSPAMREISSSCGASSTFHHSGVSQLDANFSLVNLAICSVLVLAVVASARAFYHGLVKAWNRTSYRSIPSASTGLSIESKGTSAAGATCAEPTHHAI